MVGWRLGLRPFHYNALKQAGKGVLQAFMRKGRPTTRGHR